MKKIPSNTYENRKHYNDILLNNTTNNVPFNNKNLIKKPIDLKPTDDKLQNKAVANLKNPTATNLNKSTTQSENKNPKYKSEEIKEDTKEDQGKKDLKSLKPKIPRIKLDEKSLFYSENGLKILYDTIAQTSFKLNRPELTNLNKFIQIYKNWHFMLFPKYNIDYFTNKIIDLGKKPAGKAYFSRIRKIYKGEESWDVLYSNQEEILNAAAKTKINQADVNATNLCLNKIFREDASSNILSNNKSPFSNVTNQFNNVTISNKANINNADDYHVEEIQELVFQNVEVDLQDNIPSFEVNEEDYMNFDEIHNDDDGKSMPKEESFAYKNEKRNFIQAFGEKSLDAIEEQEYLSTKKMKFN